MIVTYNKEQVGDVLMLTLKNSGEAKLAVERKGKVARVYREDNQELEAEGFAERLVNDQEPKFVVGEILEMVAHPDSDHLNICQVAVGPDKTVQIVAGAPNARVGLKTIVALPGAMMPDGSLIFPGALRGEKSYGMMCSPRELHLPNAPQKRGIIELDDAEVAGTPFDPARHWHE